MEQNKTSQNTTDTYATLLKCRITDCDNVTLVVTNSAGANGLTAQILASNDPQGSSASYASLAVTTAGATEIAIAAATKVPFDLPLFIWYDVQVKSTVGAAVAIGNAWLNAR